MSSLRLVQVNIVVVLMMTLFRITYVMNIFMVASASVRKVLKVLFTFAAANNLTTWNTLFCKKEPHLCTYESGSCKSLIDFTLVREPSSQFVRKYKVLVDGKYVLE